MFADIQAIDVLVWLAIVVAVLAIVWLIKRVF